MISSRLHVLFPIFLLVVAVGLPRQLHAQSTLLISGRVMISTTAEGDLAGRPIEGATVTIGDLSTLTDASGLFRIPDVPVGSVTIAVGALGFRAASRTLTFGEGDVPSLIDFNLEPLSTGSITGVVTNEADGAPIEGAVITLGGSVTTTDASGRYSLSEVEVGTGLALTISAVGFADQTVSVDVALGQETTLDVSLLQVLTTASIVGKVRKAEDGSPINNVLVQVGSVGVRTNSDGEFTVDGIEAGTLTVRISQDGFEPETIELNLNANSVNSLIVSLRPRGLLRTLRGRVFSRSTGLPIEAATVRSGEAQDSTNVSGQYTLDELRGASAAVTAEAEGFVSRTSTTALSSTGATLNFVLEPVATRLLILQAGFGFSPLTINSDGGGTVTLIAEVVGGTSPINVQATFDVVTPLGLVVPTPLGTLVDNQGDGSYILRLADLPPGSLSPGSLVIPGLTITARDAAGALATFPALNVPGAEPLETTELAPAPEPDAVAPARPLITMAGFGSTPLTHSISEGGKITLNAQVLGGIFPVRVEAFFVSTNPFGSPVTSSLGRFTGPNERGVFSLEFPALAGNNLTAGVNDMSGLTITATDQAGERSTWPDPLLPGSNEGFSVPTRRSVPLPNEVLTSPAPIIWMAGFGATSAALSGAEGGSVSLWALAAGGQGDLSLKIFTDLSGLQEFDMDDEDGDFLYEANIIDIPPGALEEGTLPIPGLRIVATDSAGQTAEWPFLRLSDRLPGASR